ncbi:unnamed protein product, partial [Ectocarpus sp. 4 AP-2014]
LCVSLSFPSLLPVYGSKLSLRFLSLRFFPRTISPIFHGSFRFIPVATAFRCSSFSSPRRRSLHSRSTLARSHYGFVFRWGVSTTRYSFQQAIEGSVDRAFHIDACVAVSKLCFVHEFSVCGSTPISPSRGSSPCTYTYPAQPSKHRQKRTPWEGWSWHRSAASHRPGSWHRGCGKKSGSRRFH